MIEAEDFVEVARTKGFQWYAGVPCSFLTPFINYIINNDTLHYLSSANEGDALATMAGVAIGGQRAVVMMQNSGLGNAVSPLTSLTYVFRIPLLVICTHRGAQDLKDEPQHELMGRITDRLLDTMEVPWESFPSATADVEAVLQRADAHLQQARRPYGLLVRKGTIAPHILRQHSMERHSEPAPAIRRDYKGGTRSARSEILQRIIELTDNPNTILIATTGFTGRELFALADRPTHLYMVGSMGCASSLGLGLALARPDLRIVVIDGDGAALIRMGNFSTLGAYGRDNLIHLVLDNEAHDSTGAQATVCKDIAFSQIAQACGYGITLEGDHPSLVDELLLNTAENGRARFGHLKIRTGTLENLPRPNLSPVQILDRLMNHIGTRF